MRGPDAPTPKNRMAGSQAAWPLELLDALEAHAQLDATSVYVRRAGAFPPLLSARGSRKRPRDELSSPQPAESADLVENEVGLCDQLEHAHRRVLARRSELCAARRTAAVAAETAESPIPALSAAVRAQRCVFQLRAMRAPPAAHPLCPPQLYSRLVSNPHEREVWVHALGARWLLPPCSAFALLDLGRWAELRALRPAGGYRVLSLDPPWHSRSAQRAHVYETIDRRRLLEQLPVAQLAAPSGCLLAVWITNSRHVQRFVEEECFRRWGARPLARWYWLKVAADGALANGADPRSPHRKPWEPLLLGYIGEGPPPPLPRRLVLCSVPSAHSQKPPLDSLLRAAATSLGRRGRDDDDGAGGSGRCGIDEEEAWRRLPKLECFARDVKPYWHAVGDEALHYQHTSHFVARAAAQHPVS